MSKALGQALRKLRDNSTLTQQQVADILHLDRSTYAYYERGTTEPDLKTIRKLAQIFNIDPALLLPDDDGKPSIRITDVTGPVFEEVPPEEEGLLDPRNPRIYTLTKDEKSFIIWYRALTKEQKRRFRGFAAEMED